jgi:hypothetical protein
MRPALRSCKQYKRKSRFDQMIYLSYFLWGLLILIFLPNFNTTWSINKDTGGLRTLSGLLCQIRPYGHMFMNTGNLLIFLILSLDTNDTLQAAAWVHWLSLQFILTFDVDVKTNLHFSALALYIAISLTFWIVVSQNYGLWTNTIPVFVTTALFAFIFLYNHYKMTTKTVTEYDIDNKPKTRQVEIIPYHTLQSLLEWAWIATDVYMIYKYEEYMRTNFQVKSHTIVE